MLNYNFAPARYLDMDCSKFSEFLLQHFDDAVIILSSKMITVSGKVIIFILPDEGDHYNIAIKILKNFEQCMSEYRAGVITNLCYHDPQVILNYNYLYHMLMKLVIPTCKWSLDVAVYVPFWNYKA